MGKFRERCAALLLCAGYLLGIHEGYLAVWRGDDPEPVHRFCLRAEDLPPADQVALRRGIYVENDRALYALLDDYL